MIPNFRAWDNNRKLMIDEVVVIDLYNECIGYLYPSKIVQGEIVSRLPINDVIIMQSTGLFDKNGKEIFEGDIVENTTQTVYLRHKFEVVWNKNYASYQLMNNGFTSNIPLEEHFMSYEVIGNIYENPELLEVDNE